MPAFPFFILTILSTYDAVERPLNQEITSQGYCYQALIYLFLRKEGVGNNEFDIYINFLTELAYHIYDSKKSDLSTDEFETFMASYRKNFNFPLDLKLVQKKLANVNLVRFDSFNNYGFCYPYLYYFFVAKYLSDHIERKKVKEEIDRIIMNLHKDENSYIAVFISHHTKGNYLLDEVLLNAQILFEDYAPSTLDAKEMEFFDRNEELIVKAVLPAFSNSTDGERKKMLEEKNKSERNAEYDGSNRLSENNSTNKENELDLLANLRRSVKTVEVMGMMIKNRSGSLEKNKLEEIFREAMKVHLRILNSFFEFIKDENSEAQTVEMLKERVQLVLQEKNKDKKQEPDLEEVEKIARKIFWNTNFAVVYSFLNKIIHSLGSNQLLQISSSVHEKEQSPSSFIIHQGILMWYGKNLRVEEIVERVNNDGFSKTALKVLKHRIVEHCRLHKMKYQDLIRIEQELKIPSKYMLVERGKTLSKKK